MTSNQTSDKREIAGNRAKALLRNVIRHTDTHNRLLEEAEMWNLHAKMKDGYLVEREMGAPGGQGRHKNGSRRARPRDNSDVKNSFLYDDRESVPVHPSSGRGKGLMKRAHMDDEKADDDEDMGQSSTFWLRKLYKAEEGDEDRWGHSGYKELYPRDFESDRSDGEEKKKSKDINSSSSNSDSDSTSNQVKIKKKKSSSKDSLRKRKKRKEKKKKEKKRKEETSSEESSDEVKTSHRKSKKRKLEVDGKDRDEERRKKKSVKQKDKSSHKRKRKKKRSF